MLVLQILKELVFHQRCEMAGQPQCQQDTCMVGGVTMRVAVLSLWGGGGRDGGTIGEDPCGVQLGIRGLRGRLGRGKRRRRRREGEWDERMEVAAHLWATGSYPKASSHTIVKLRPHRHVSGFLNVLKSNCRISTFISQAYQRLLYDATMQCHTQKCPACNVINIQVLNTIATLHTCNMRICPIQHVMWWVYLGGALPVNSRGGIVRRDVRRGLAVARVNIPLYAMGGRERKKEGEERREGER